MSSLRLNAIAERLRGSLFVVPTAFTLLGAVLGIVMVRLDGSFDGDPIELPFMRTSTVDSAREVLGTVATATITVTGVAFSIALLVIQQAASRYSPRVVHSLFRDPFNRRVLGFALGTFTYCLLVLRSVRGPLEDGGQPVIPNLSVALAVALGVASILAIVAFIDHSAHSMEVSQILHRVNRDAVDQVEASWPQGDDRSTAPDRAVPDVEGHPVRLRSSGWIQQVSADRLLELLPDGGTVRLETCPGRYAVAGTPWCTVWPTPDDPADLEDRASEAIQTGPVRTMQQDASYGLRQLADVALIALSPGVNDPTTAQEAIFHLTEVLARMFERDLPPTVVRDDRGRTLVRTEDPDHAELVALAFDEIRRSAAPHPTVSIYLLEALHLLDRSFDGAHPERRAPIRAQADRIVQGAERSDLLPRDLDEVRRAHARRFA